MNFSTLDFASTLLLQLDCITMAWFSILTVSLRQSNCTLSFTPIALKRLCTAAADGRQDACEDTNDIRAIPEKVLGSLNPWAFQYENGSAVPGTSTTYASRPRRLCCSKYGLKPFQAQSHTHTEHREHCEFKAPCTCSYPKSLPAHSYLVAKLTIQKVRARKRAS